MLYLPLIAGDTDQLTLGRFVGLIGLQLIWWQIVLGNRQITHLLTPDLLWVNELHRYMGTYGFLLILLHPLLMVAAYGLTIVWPPSFANTFDIGVRLGMTALALLSFVWVVSAVLRKKIAWRVWKRLHFLGYVVLPLLYLHMLLIGSSIQQFWCLAIWLNGIIVVFWGIVLLRILNWAGITKRRFTVIETSLVAKDVTRFRLQPVSKGIKPRPGQFAYLQGWRFSEAHPFTVSHYDETSNEISFSIKAVGPYSRKLTTLQTGDTVYIDGPYGVFTEEIGASDRQAVAIVGGIGITPFIRHLEAGGINYLFWGCRTEADIAYRDIVDTSRAKVYYVLSKQTKEVSGYETGMITIDLIKKNLPERLSEYDFYLCGPPPMMQSLHAELLDNGVYPAAIRQEKFSL